MHDADGLFVVDKPSGLPVHGGDVEHGDDLVTRLRVRFRERGEPDYLGVQQRLDKDASGVIAFTRRAELNAAVARELETRAAKRRYLAAVTLAPGQHGLSEAGVLEHRLEPAERGRMRVVPRGGKLAVSRYRVLERSGPRALVDLELETGRTHQLRVQLAEAGATIAGDSLYGGAPAPRLLLHAYELVLMKASYRAKAPPELALFLRGLSAELPGPEELVQRIRDAGSRRWPLREEATAFRLVSDLGDGVPGVSVDCYADFAVLEVFSEAARERAPEIAERLIELGVRGVYLKSRGEARAEPGSAASSVAPAEPLAGEAAPASLEVRESELRLRVELGDGLSTGLFVDQRDNRARVRKLAKGARVLNLFAYTCSFSVAAALGGAASTLSVDLSSKALARGRESFEINELAGAAHRLLRDDAVKFLARARRRAERYDLIVLDPPTFARVGKRNTFRFATDYVEIARDALALLAPGGRLLAVTNHRATSQATLRRLLRDAAQAAKRRVVQLKDLPSPLDCPRRLGEPHPSKSVLVTVE